jgi:hypothetical protein
MIPTKDVDYTFRCIEETFDKSKSSDSFMITREWELVSPDSVLIDGEEFSIAGMKFTQRLVTKVSDGKGGFDSNKTKLAMGRLYNDYDKFGIDKDEVIDESNPRLLAKGKLARFSMRNKEEKWTEKLTEAEVKAGKKYGEGAPIIDPDTGKQKVSIKPELGFLLDVIS